MTSLTVECTRGDLVESVHQVSVAVVAPTGRLVAAAGDPERMTWWRSAAKPFQAMPLVEDGAADRFGLDPEELALACASHSSEPRHLAVVERFMAKVGVAESDLACGPHPPLSPAAQRELLREDRAPTPRWSNCSGKHTGMLALARHHGWSLPGYAQAGHPVQQRILGAVSEWSGVPADRIHQSVDGCAAVCFGLPLSRMATAWARFGTSDRPAPRRLRQAMLAHPFLVAGTGRSCTEFMAAWPGAVLAKIGAEGVYGAALPALGLGVALKVEDGDLRCSAIALLAILRQLSDRDSGSPLATVPPSLAEWMDPPVRNTRGEETGRLQVAGELVFVHPDG